jgi:hypothetical protein
MVCKILLLVARIVCGDEALAVEIKHVANAVANGRYDSRVSNTESKS